jgi:hypothetical protein
LRRALLASPKLRKGSYFPSFLDPAADGREGSDRGGPKPMFAALDAAAIPTCIYTITVAANRPAMAWRDCRE